MRHNGLVNGFNDLDEHSWGYFRPNEVIRKTDTDNDRYRTTAELFMAQGSVYRRVTYEVVGGTRYYMELTPYIHPTGAATITLGTVATSAAGVVTYTPTLEGRMLNESGVQIAPTEEARDVAGMLLTDYFTLFTDNIYGKEEFRVLTISEGDLLWLVRNGRVELDVTGTVTAGDIVVSSATVAGEVESAGAIDTASVAAYAASKKKNELGTASPMSFGLALARATGTDTRVLCDLTLPPRYAR